MPYNPLKKLFVPPQEKRSSVEEARELLRQYVSEYNVAENDLRIKWRESEEKYSREARRADMQKMIDAEEKIKQLILPEKLVEKIKKNEFDHEGQRVHTGKWAYMASHYADYQKIKSGQKSPEAFFSDIGASKEQYGITGPTVETNKSANAPAEPKEPQKPGLFGWIKEKASDFAHYMKKTSCQRWYFNWIGRFGCGCYYRRIRVLRWGCSCCSCRWNGRCVWCWRNYYAGWRCRSWWSTYCS